MRSTLQDALDENVWKLRRWDPTPNPYPCLARMQDIANTLVTQDVKELYCTFEPFLREASHEEWQLLLQYVWVGLLGPVEWRLFEATKQLIKISSSSSQLVKQAEVVLDGAFMEAPPTVYISFNATKPGFSRRNLLEQVVAGVQYFVQKRETEVKVKRVLREYQLRLETGRCSDACVDCNAWAKAR